MNKYAFKGRKSAVFIFASLLVNLRSSGAQEFLQDKGTISPLCSSVDLAPFCVDGRRSSTPSHFYPMT